MNYPASPDGIRTVTVFVDEERHRPSMRALFECCYVINKELEPMILSDPESAYYYAKEIIQGRWEEAEEVFFKDIFYVFLYAKDVIKNKLPEIMHNKMLIIAATSDNKREVNIAKAYLSLFK